MGCPGCLALAIGLAVRALFGAETPTLGVLPAGADSVNAPETSTSSGWSGSWIEKWLNPGDTSSAPGDGQQPQGEVDQPAANVMGAEAPDPMWLKNHISRSFFGENLEVTPSATRSQICSKGCIDSDGCAMLPSSLAVLSRPRKERKRLSGFIPPLSRVSISTLLRIAGIEGDVTQLTGKEASTY